MRAGYLVQVRANRDFDLHGVSYPFARPETRTFTLRLANQYRLACGEKLVVTSLTRPLSRQPRNASSRSVHPTGMALDVRRSNHEELPCVAGERPPFTGEERGPGGDKGILSAALPHRCFPGALCPVCGPADDPERRTAVGLLGDPGISGEERGFALGYRPSPRHHRGPAEAGEQPPG